MRKLMAILTAILCCCSLMGCQSKPDTAETPNALVPSVMYEGNLYCNTGKQMPVEVDESAILGKISSTVPISQWPTEDGQANFEALDAPFALISEGFVVFVENEWTLFEMRDVDASEEAAEESVQETPEAEEFSDSAKEIVTFAEEQAMVLEDYIANDALTQTDLNIKTQELYEVWDSALNQLWDILKQTLSAEKMEYLLIEQREWITRKEQAVEEAGAEYEGGSIQSMVMNNKATELTKERIYELLELLE